MTLTFLNQETATALVREGLPTIEGIGRKAETTLPEELRTLIAGLEPGQYVPVSKVANDADNKAKRECVAHVAKWNRVVARTGEPFHFAIRSGVDGDNAIVTIFAGRMETNGDSE